MRYRLGMAVGYGAILVLFAYRDDNAPSWVGYLLLFVLPFVASLAAGPWVVLALPAVVLATVPAGYGSGEAEFPVWFGMMFVALVALPVIVVGSAARWFVARYASR
jgi:hypothetical protein